MERKKLRIAHTVAVVGFIALGLLALGSATPPSDPVAFEPARVDWSLHPHIPIKNYVVVGAVVLRNTTTVTVLVDLMEQAIAMGGHDIMNVRVNRVVCEDAGTAIVSATAVVIRFTDENLIGADGRPISTEQFIGPEPQSVVGGASPERWGPVRRWQH